MNWEKNVKIIFVMMIKFYFFNNYKNNLIFLTYYNITIKISHYFISSKIYKI